MENNRQTFNEIINGDKPVLVDFYADWCGPCKMMTPIIDGLVKEMGESIRVLKVDVDRNPRAAAAYGIQGVPTIILFRRGDILWRQSGVVPAHVLRKVVTPHLV